MLNKRERDVSVFNFFVYIGNAAVSYDKLKTRDGRADFHTLQPTFL